MDNCYIFLFIHKGGGDTGKVQKTSKVTSEPMHAPSVNSIRRHHAMRAVEFDIHFTQCINVSDTNTLKSPVLRVLHKVY